MMNIVDYSSLASTIVLFSLQRAPTRVSVTFDLLMNKIIVQDDCKSEKIEENAFFPSSFASFVKELSRNCCVDAISRCGNELQRQTYGEKQKFLQKPLASGTIISCTKIFAGNSLKIGELINKKEMLMQQRRFLKFINSLSIIHPSVSFHVNGACSSSILDLPCVCSSSSEFSLNTRARSAISSRFLQITDSLPLFSSNENIIQGKIDFITEQKFEPFLIKTQTFTIPATSVSINGNEVMPQKSMIQIFHRDIASLVWKRSGLDVDLKETESTHCEHETLMKEVGADVIKEMKFVGLWERKFIIAQHGEIIYAIDQHAAHERVNLSRLIERSDVERHPHELKKPIEILDSFGFPHESCEAMAALREWGWRISGKRFITAVPCICGVVIDSIEGMIKFACSVATGTKPVMPECIIDALRTRACKTAIRFGDYIDDRTAKNLLVALGNTDRPNHCAHGRTVVAPILDLERPLSKFSGL